MATATISERLDKARKQFGTEVCLTEPFPDNPPLWIEPLKDSLRSDFAIARRWVSDHRGATQFAMQLGTVISTHNFRKRPLQ